MDTAEIKWCEISVEASRARYDALSTELKEVGVSNSVSFIETSEKEFPQVLAQAQTEFDQIRLSGVHCQTVCRISNRTPSSILSLRTADAVVRTQAADRWEWWPRNYFVEGVGQSVAKGIKNLDFSGNVFIVGANESARAVAAALVRVGFLRFNITNPVEEDGVQLVEDLRSAYFNAQFNFVPRHLVTQLPGVHSFAVNTLASGKDDGTLTELFYFNFLKPAGVWLDLALTPINTALDAEARTVGANVQPGTMVYALADAVWAKACFDIELDVDRYAKLLRDSHSSESSASPHV